MFVYIFVDIFVEVFVEILFLEFQEILVKISDIIFGTFVEYFTQPLFYQAMGG